MHAQRELLSRVDDYALAAWLAVDDAGATLQRVAPVRKNASPALIWQPVIRFMIDQKVRPTKVAMIVSKLAGVDVATARGWTYVQ